jgi:hypothetical protein
MKTILNITLITASLIFTGINTLKDKTLKPEKEEIKLPEGIKIYKPYFSPIAPTCPSAEYQLASRQAEGQSLIVQTEHCPKCNLGALYEKSGNKICTYCESNF